MGQKRKEMREVCLVKKDKRKLQTKPSHRQKIGACLESPSVESICLSLLTRDQSVNH